MTAPEHDAAAGIAEALAAAEAEAANPTEKPAGIAAAEASRAAWKALSPAEKQAAIDAAVADLASGRLRPDGL